MLNFLLDIGDISVSPDTSMVAVKTADKFVSIYPISFNKGNAD